jgi:chromosome partitioning protein
MIISILNSKGGSGKTTICTNLAQGLKQKGYRVLLIDSDPQGSLRDWRGMIDDDVEALPVIAIDRPSIEKDVESLKKAYDFILIDGAAKSNQMNVSALKASDGVLIPTQPSGVDLWAVAELVEMIKTRQNITEGKPKSAFVVSRAIQGTTLAKDVIEALAGYDLPLLKSRTFQRIAYADAITQGLTVLQTEPQGKASQEIEQLTNEVLIWLTN